MNDPDEIENNNANQHTDSVQLKNTKRGVSHGSAVEIVTNSNVPAVTSLENAAQTKAKSSNNHGGARNGAGRKATNGKTKVMRIPVQYINAVQALVNHLKAQSESLEVEPTSVYLRDLRDRQLDLTITSQLRRLKS